MFISSVSSIIKIKDVFNAMKFSFQIFKIVFQPYSYLIQYMQRTWAKLNLPIQILTGAGTFENYVSVGAGCGATPDGRLNGQPTASDCSPQPYAQVSTFKLSVMQIQNLPQQDKPVPRTHLLDIVDSLKPYSERNLHLYVSNGILSIPGSIQFSLQCFIPIK